MLRTAAGFALLLTSFVLPAQSNSNPGALNSSTEQVQSVPDLTIIVLPTVNAACPIDMHARQGVWDHTIRVRDGERDRVLRPFGQRVSLTLKDSHSAHIISATVRVHGLNGKQRMLPTPTEGAQRWNSVTTRKINFVEEDDGSVSSDLWINGFTAVYSLQLLDVTYADGSIWRPSGSDVCRVQPDPLMLITER